MDVKKKALIDDYVRACKRDAGPAWDSAEGRALVAAFDTASVAAADFVIGWWDSTAPSGFRWQEGIVREDVADGTPVYVGASARAFGHSIASWPAAGGAHTSVADITQVGVLTDDQCQTLKEAALAATPQNIDTAEIIERSEDGGRVIQCPVCDGEGHAVLEGEYCNYDGEAIGVQFYGVGNAQGAAEAYLRAATPANVLALIARLERAEAALPARSTQHAPLTAEDVERQYKGGIHIGSGLRRATCPCGFCKKHRFGFHRGDDQALSAQTAAGAVPNGGQRDATVKSHASGDDNR